MQQDIRNSVVKLRALVNGGQQHLFFFLYECWMMILFFF